MIITLLINLVVMLFGALFVFLPVVHLPDVVHNVLATMVSYWNGFMVTFPYAQLPFSLFLTVILPFEVTLLVAKFFLGNRLPVHN